jgi:hypothetical protein
MPMQHSQYLLHTETSAAEALCKKPSFVVRRCQQKWRMSAKYAVVCAGLCCQTTLGLGTPQAQPQAMTMQASRHASSHNQHETDSTSCCTDSSAGTKHAHSHDCHSYRPTKG